MRQYPFAEFSKEQQVVIPIGEKSLLIIALVIDMIKGVSYDLHWLVGLMICWVKRTVNRMVTLASGLTARLTGHQLEQTPAVRRAVRPRHSIIRGLTYRLTSSDPDRLLCCLNSKPSGQTYRQTETLHHPRSDGTSDRNHHNPVATASLPRVSMRCWRMLRLRYRPMGSRAPPCR